MFVVTEVVTTESTSVHNYVKIMCHSEISTGICSLSNYFQMAKHFFNPFASYVFGNKSLNQS